MRSRPQCALIAPATIVLLASICSTTPASADSVSQEQAEKRLAELDSRNASPLDAAFLALLGEVIYSDRDDLAVRMTNRLLKTRGVKSKHLTIPFQRLMEANSLSSRKQLTRRFIDAGVDVNIRAGHDDNPNPILTDAVKRKEFWLVKWLVVAGADVNARMSPKHDEYDFEGTTPLTVAREHKPIFDYLVRKGARLEVCRTWGVVGRRVSIRTRPSARGRASRTLRKGQIVVIVAANRGWLQVVDKSRRGWVQAKHIEPAKGDDTERSLSYDSKQFELWKETELKKTKSGARFAGCHRTWAILKAPDGTRFRQRLTVGR